MSFRITKIHLISIALFSAFFFVFLFNVNGASAAGLSFFVDSSYDKFQRSSLSASLLYSSNKAEFYIEDSYLSTLGGFSRDRLDEQIQALASIFDNQIYNNLTRTFGLEWTPGIDGNPKLTILFIQMKTGIGGFFRVEDEQSVGFVSNSNEREMVYLNIDFLKEQKRVSSFLAHEFQHVINYNQKNRLRRVADELWFNEMLSEIAPAIAGLDSEYEGSNVEARIEQFLNAPTDPLMLWEGKSEDYGVVNILAQYMYDKYGSQFFTLLEQTSKTGEEAINEALTTMGKQERFLDVFKNWVVTVMLNNCNVIPQNTYCYKNSNLSADNLKIRFNINMGSGDEFSTSDSVYPWQGQWFKYERVFKDVRPSDHIFVLEFSVLENVDFLVPYVVFPKAGSPQIFFASFQNKNAKFFVEDFGYKINKVVIMPMVVSSELNNPRVFVIKAHVSETIPQDAINSNPDDTPFELPQSITSLDLNIPDGALIRAQGDMRVFTTKGNYKRWIQSAEIMDMYGHLRWEDIIEVSQNTLDEYLISNAVRFAGDPKVYVIDSNNRKTWIKTEQEFISLGYSFNMVYEINEREFNFYQ